MAAGQGRASASLRPTKSPEAFRTISEVAALLDVPPHVLRFWESKFTQVRPLKRGGLRRYYRPEDVELLRHIRGLLYGDGYAIRGVQKVLRERGARGFTTGERHSSDGADGLGAASTAEDPLDGGQRQRIEAAIDELAALSDMLKSARR